MITRNQKIVFWVVQNYLKNPPMREMKEDLSFGRDISKVVSDFYEEYGVTPDVFMKQRRMRYAIQQLANPRMAMSMHELVRILNCRSEAAFSTEFESVYGMTPWVYRTQILQKLGSA